MKQLAVLLFLLFSFKLFGQAVEKPYGIRNYKYAIGVLGNHKTIGIQAESRISENIGIRIAGSSIIGYDRSKEFGVGGIGLITYYIPINSKIIEPVIGLGGVYSLYHWNMKFDKGNLNDFNIGGGIGTNIRFCNKLRGGINGFAVNSFKTNYNYGSKTMEITGRKLLILPTLTFDYLF